MKDKEKKGCLMSMYKDKCDKTGRKIWIFLTILIIAIVTKL